MAGEHEAQTIHRAELAARLATRRTTRRRAGRLPACPRRSSRSRGRAGAGRAGRRAPGWPSGRPRWPTSAGTSRSGPPASRSGEECSSAGRPRSRNACAATPSSGPKRRPDGPRSRPRQWPRAAWAAWSQAGGNSSMASSTPCVRPEERRPSRPGGSPITWRSCGAGAPAPSASWPSSGSGPAVSSSTRRKPVSDSRHWWTPSAGTSTVSPTPPVGRLCPTCPPGPVRRAGRGSSSANCASSGPSTPLPSRSTPPCRSATASSRLSSTTSGPAAGS